MCISVYVYRHYVDIDILYLMVMLKYIDISHLVMTSPPGELGIVDLDSKMVGRVAAKRVSQMSKKSLANLKPKLVAS